ncbi:hypothetical protein [Pseudoruegeria sp. SHC-113]|uniref:hypothetical protein n=1 Tax=Pseudoruegeria sp. SHC-113 TaxID=2855439 RepID=UPI0021BAE0F7|nr:hypothetical protein [Pseudoruegeria sp. SHC-113]MCT8159532.1 hypothetical protein [Pseudoruegeria sp. SHC-113]
MNKTLREQDFEQDLNQLVKGDKDISTVLAQYRKDVSDWGGTVRSRTIGAACLVILVVAVIF